MGPSRGLFGLCKFRKVPLTAQTNTRHHQFQHTLCSLLSLLSDPFINDPKASDANCPQEMTRKMTYELQETRNRHKSAGRCLQSRHSIQIRFYSIFCGHIHCWLHPPTVLWDTWQISGALGRSVDTAVSECNTTHYHQFILPAHNRYLNHCPCTQCTLLWLHNVVNIKYTT